MAYGFNTDKSKIQVYSKAEVDQIFSNMARNICDGAALNSLRTTGSTEEEEGEYSLGAHAFAEGWLTKAHGFASHAEGASTLADGYGAHAAGMDTFAYADYSYAGGVGTSARGWAQTIIGMYNVPEGAEDQIVDNACPIFIIGNGTDNNNRSNAFTVDLNGHFMARRQSTSIDASWYKSDFTPGIGGLMLRKFGGVVELTGSFQTDDTFTMTSGTDKQILQIPTGNDLLKYVPASDTYNVAFSYGTNASSARFYTCMDHLGRLWLGLIHNSTTETITTNNKFIVHMMWLANPMAPNA